MNHLLEICYERPSYMGEQLLLTPKHDSIMQEEGFGSSKYWVLTLESLDNLSDFFTIHSKGKNITGNSFKPITIKELLSLEVDKHVFDEYSLIRCSRKGINYCVDYEDMYDKHNGGSLKPVIISLSKSADWVKHSPNTQLFTITIRGLFSHKVHIDLYIKFNFELGGGGG